MKIKNKISFGLTVAVLLALSACAKPIKQEYVNKFKKIGLISFIPNTVQTINSRLTSTDIMNSSYPLYNINFRDDYARELYKKIKESTDFPIIPYDPKAVEKARIEAIYDANLTYKTGSVDLEAYRKLTGCDAVFILSYMPRTKRDAFKVNAYGFIFGGGSAYHRVAGSTATAYLADQLYLYDLNEKQVVWEFESYYWESISAAAGDGSYSNFADLEKDNLAPLKRALISMYKSAADQYAKAMGKGIKGASKSTQGSTTIFDQL